MLRLRVTPPTIAVTSGSFVRPTAPAPVRLGTIVPRRYNLPITFPSFVVVPYLT
jgi:hypothetical protein